MTILHELLYLVVKCFVLYFVFSPTGRHHACKIAHGVKSLPFSVHCHISPALTPFRLLSVWSCPSLPFQTKFKVDIVCSLSSKRFPSIFGRVRIGDAAENRKIDGKNSDLLYFRRLHRLPPFLAFFAATLEPNQTVKFYFNLYSHAYFHAVNIFSARLCMTHRDFNSETLQYTEPCSQFVFTSSWNLCRNANEPRQHPSSSFSSSCTEMMMTISKIKGQYNSYLFPRPLLRN